MGVRGARVFADASRLLLVQKSGAYPRFYLALKHRPLASCPTVDA